VIAKGCATPKLKIIRELKDGTRENATNIPEHRLLTRRPNEWQTSYEWRKMMTLHAALTGAGLSIKVKNDNNRLRELIPVAPGNWHKRRVSRYEVVYDVYDEFGLIGNFGSDDVFELPNMQWEWCKNLNSVQLAASAIGLALASEKSQEAIHKNGMRPTGAYSVEGNLTPEQHTRLDGWIKKRQGVANSGTPLILDRSAKWLDMAMKNTDAQSIETRRLQIEEVCRAFGVFPIMIGHSDKTSTFASSESFFSAHLVHTLAPWHECWTQRIDEFLLDGQGPLEAKFDTRYMRAGAMKDRSQWNRTMAEMGIYTRNELREEEGKDPLPGLDDPLTPMNMTNGQTGATNEDPAATP
jgi:HK97 family phage portal protein